MSQFIPVSTSFVQDKAHLTKTQKFVAIQPSQVEAALKPYGFNLVSLKTGRARLADRADHQTTIARYRSENELKINGLSMDLVFKIPHLYGAIEAFLGTYRQVCSNGLVVGQKFFECPRIRHVGNALNQLETLIPIIIAKHNELADSIREMQSRNVTPEALAIFVKEIAQLRLGQNEKIVSIQYNDLMRVRRDADNGQDVFSILNVVQENVMRYGLRYQTETTAQDGTKLIRNMNARPVTRNENESVKSVDLNASIWDAATRILMAA